MTISGSQAAMNKVIAIVGPTASGKSALAMKMAKKYGGEIVCADSRTIYKGLTIGTAKPSIEDQKVIRHHCLDLINPDQNFSAAAFQTVAKKAIKSITQQGKIIFFVGGSGLYIDGVLYNFNFQPSLSQNLAGLSLDALNKLADEQNLQPSAQTRFNKRHLQGLINRGMKRPERASHSGALIIGLNPGGELLSTRITERVEEMFTRGLVTETQKAIDQYGFDAPGLQAPGYKAVGNYIKGIVDENEAKQLFIRYDKQLAKRQITWFKRNKDIQWFDNTDAAEQYIKEKLS